MAENCYRCGENPISNKSLGLCVKCDCETAAIVAGHREKDRKSAEAIQKLMRGEKISWLDEPVQGRC